MHPNLANFFTNLVRSFGRIILQIRLKLLSFRRETSGAGSSGVAWELLPMDFNIDWHQQPDNGVVGPAESYAREYQQEADGSWHLVRTGTVRGVFSDPSLESRN